MAFGWADVSREVEQASIMCSRIRNRFISFCAWSAAAFFVGFSVSAAEPHKEGKDAFRAFVLSAGAPGGVYLPLGRSLCHLYNRDRPAGLPTCLAMKSGGSIENIERLRRGEADMAIVQSDVAHWAQSGDGPFSDAAPFQHLRLLFPAHDETLTFLVREDIAIQEISDFLGKRIAIAGSKTGSHFTTEAVLDALGWSRGDFASFTSEPMADEIEALCSGKTDIAVLVVGHPNGFVQRALTECHARLEQFVGPQVERMIKNLNFLHMAEIEPGHYAKQTGAVRVPSLSAVVVVRSGMSKLVAEQFVSTIIAHETTLRKLHLAFRNIDLRRSIPLMKGIEKYMDLPPR